ncbi:hypothetical protein [Streptomyces sp. NPDC086787]
MAVGDIPSRIGAAGLEALPDCRSTCGGDQGESFRHVPVRVPHPRAS